MSVRKGVRTKKSSFRLNWLLAVSILLLAGGGYRQVESRLKLMQAPVELPVPLGDFPFRVGNWVGRDVSVPEYIQRVAGNDDFLNRLYVNNLTGQWASVYVSYSGQPRTMVGHTPEVCYVGGGWIHKESGQSGFVTPAGRSIPCLIHRFHKPSPSWDEIIVLNFYILNGQLSSDESGFSGIGWRAPNIRGNSARYVAQVQISSVLENSVRAAARDITGPILEFFPDKDGRVKAADYAKFKGGLLE